MGQPRYEQPRMVRVKTLTSTNIEGRYYDDGRVEIFLANERVHSGVLD